MSLSDPPDRPPTDFSDLRATSGKADRPARAGMGFGGVFVMSALAAAGGAGLALTAPAIPQIAAYLPKPPAAAPLPAVAALEAEQAALRDALDALTARVAALETASPAMPAAPSQDPAAPATPGADAPAAPTIPGAVAAQADLEALVARVASLETRLAALDPTGAGGQVIAGLQADIAALKATVDVMRATAAAQPTGPSSAAAFAGLALADAAARPGPFPAEWEQARIAAPDDPAVAALADLAKRGAPTPAQLAERFVAVRSEISAAVATEAQADGFMGWIQQLFARLFTVRSTAGATGNGPDALAARAQAKLAQGDLAGAVSDVEALTGPAESVAADWLARARDRLAIDRYAAAARIALQTQPQRAPAAPPAVAIAPANPAAPAAPTGAVTP